MRKLTLREHVAQWYRGSYEPYENDPDSGAFVVGGWYNRHWTARAVRTIVKFYLTHWQWVIGTAIAIMGLVLAYMAIG